MEASEETGDITTQKGATGVSAGRRWKLFGIVIAVAAATLFSVQLVSSNRRPEPQEGVWNGKAGSLSVELRVFPIRLEVGQEVSVTVIAHDDDGPSPGSMVGEKTGQKILTLFFGDGTDTSPDIRMSVAHGPGCTNEDLPPIIFDRRNHFRHKYRKAGAYVIAADYRTITYECQEQDLVSVKGRVFVK